MGREVVGAWSITWSLAVLTIEEEMWRERPRLSNKEYYLVKEKKKPTPQKSHQGVTSGNVKTNSATQSPSSMFKTRGEHI